MRVTYRAPNKGTVLKTRQNKCVKGFEYKSLVTFANKTSFLGNMRSSIVNMLFKCYLSSIVIPRSLRELETPRSSQHKVNGGWGGKGVLDRLIVIKCVLRGLNFIPRVKHYDRILAKSLFKELATFVRSEGNATSA